MFRRRRRSLSPRMRALTLCYALGYRMVPGVCTHDVHFADDLSGRMSERFLLGIAHCAPYPAFGSA